MERSDPSYKGQAAYNPLLLAIYDVWVIKFMARAVWKTPIPPVVELYRRHLGSRHLEVGPGTGYCIEKAGRPRAPRSPSSTRTPTYSSTRRDGSRQWHQRPSRPT